jgi:hypothetical protein
MHLTNNEIEPHKYHADPVKDSAGAPAKLLDDSPGLFHNFSYDVMRSAQHWEDQLALKNLSIAELYVRGDLKVWLPARTAPRFNETVWPNYGNSYAIIEASVGSHNESDCSRARLAASVDLHVPHDRGTSNGAGWYDFNVTVVIRDTAEIPKKIVTPSRIGFFSDNKVGELRAKKVLKSITHFTSIASDFSLEEDFTELPSSSCEREIDEFNMGSGAAVTARHYDRKMLKGGSKVIDGVSDEPRNGWRNLGHHLDLDEFVSTLDIDLFKDAVRIGVTKFVELPFSFLDI